MDSLLCRATPDDVQLDPFPHLVVENALDPAVADRLVAEFPPLEVVTGGLPFGSNQRFSYAGSEAADDPSLSPLWREFVRMHQSQAFLDELLRLFAEPIRVAYPWFESRIGPLDELRAGVRFRDTYDTADVLLEAQPSVNTPVTATPTSVRAGHLDNPDKLFVGLYYLRHPGDESTGGDLELYRYRPGTPVFAGHEIADRYIEAVERVRYERNTLVVFMNSPVALHGVTPRSQTPVPRLFLNLGAEVATELFEPPGRHVPAEPESTGARLARTAREHALAVAVLAFTWLFLLFVFLPEELGDRPYDAFGLRF